MSDLYKILPDVILYLSCGFAFLIGFYLINDQRFNFFSDISFTVMLVLGFSCAMLIEYILALIGVNVNYCNLYEKSIVFFIVSFLSGFGLAILKNVMGERIVSIAMWLGRRKSMELNFWHSLLDSKEKPVWLRLYSKSNDYVLEGVLISIDEKDENPYLVLSYCRKYDLHGHRINDVFYRNDTTQCVVRADSFDEILLIYAENSDKCIELNVVEN